MTDRKEAIRDIEMTEEFLRAKGMEIKSELPKETKEELK